MNGLVRGDRSSNTGIVMEAIMSGNAERWLAEQEIALLERVYALESPAEHEDDQEVIRVEARKVRLWRSAAQGPQSNGTIGR
jgi:hypothetical protein